MIFRQIANARANMRRAGSFAEQKRLALPAARDAEHDLDERRLAGAVLAQKAIDLAILDVQRNARESFDLPVAFPQVSGFQYWHEATSSRWFYRTYKQPACPVRTPNSGYLGDKQVAWPN